MSDAEHWVLHVESRPYRRGDARYATAALGEAVGVAKAALGKLKRRKFFSDSVMGGTGVIEPRYDAVRGFWDVHFHLVLDVLKLDEGALDAAWKDLVGRRGRARRDPENDDDLETSNRPLAKYLAKLKDWCPSPRQLGAAEFEALSVAMKGRQRLVRPWGTAKPVLVDPKRGDNVVPSIPMLDSGIEPQCE